MALVDANALEGGRYRFVMAPGVSTTMDVQDFDGEWASGIYFGPHASHSADRARHGELQYVNVKRALWIEVAE